MEEYEPDVDEYIQSLRDRLEKSQTDYALLQDDYKNLLIDLAGRDAIIKELESDIKWHKKDWKDQMIQDQGLDE